MAVPSDIASLQQWFKADAITGLSDGDPVATWEDSSTNNRDATQSTAGNRPLYKTGIVNSLPVVRFDGSNDYLITSGVAGFLSGLSAAEVFLVVKVNADPAAADGSAGLWAMTGSADNTAFPYTDGNVYDGFGSSVRKSTGNPTLSLASTFRLYNVVSISGEWTSYVDGTQHFTTGTNTVSFGAGDGYLGTSVALGSIVLAGDIAEFFLFNAKLSTADRQAMNAYIATKYGLTIADTGGGGGISIPVVNSPLRAIRPLLVR